VAQLIDQLLDSLSFLAEQRQRKPKKKGKEKNLENIPFGKCVDNTCRDNIHKEICGGKRFGAGCVGRQRFRVQLGDIGIETGPRLDESDNGEADNERQCTDDLEIQQGLRPYPPNFLHILHPGYPGNHGAEDDRSDHHLDQFYETVSQRFHRRTDVRHEIAEGDTDCDCR